MVKVYKAKVHKVKVYKSKCTGTYVTECVDT